MRRLRALLVVAALAVGCGPSFQAIYEGDVRFEHCYALDENPSVAMQQKEECWGDWLQHYSYGQTRDRVVYAKARTRAMKGMGELPTDEAMMSAAPGGEGSRSGITAPAPTSAFAPPPKTLAEPDAGAGADGGDWSRNAPTATWMTSMPPPPPPSFGGDGGASPFGSSTLRPPGADCTETCVHDWNRCRATCPAPRPPAAVADAGASGAASGANPGGAAAACSGACDRTYRGCLRGCVAK